MGAGVVVAAVLLLAAAPEGWAYRVERIKDGEYCYVTGNPPKATCEARKRGDGPATWMGPYDSKDDCERQRAYLKGSSELGTSPCQKVLR